MLSNPHLAQILLGDLQVRGDTGWGGAGGGVSAVTVEIGSPPTRLISAIGENMASIFSFVTAIYVVNLDYRAEQPDYAVKCLLLRDRLTAQVLCLPLVFP